MKQSAIWTLGAVLSLASCRLSSLDPLVPIEEDAQQDPIVEDPPDQDEGPTDSAEDTTSCEQGCPEGTICGAEGLCIPNADDPEVEEELDGRITWVGQIEAIFARQCVECHFWCADYDAVAIRCERGTMEYYIDNRHFIFGEDRELTLQWLEEGWPLE